MTVADYMTKQVVTISPETKVADAVAEMTAHQIHRLPVTVNGQLVGLVTAGVIAAASPSKATSLSIYEVNYLFNTMTVGDIMIKEVTTITGAAPLEQAIFQMRQQLVGVLPVVDGRVVVGIITTNDLLDAFLDITDYSETGEALQVLVQEDRPGVILDVSAALAHYEISIQTLMVTRHLGKPVIEIHVAPEQEAAARRVLTTAGFSLR